jgi:hypothetical protein
MKYLGLLSPNIQFTYGANWISPSTPLYLSVWYIWLAVSISRSMWTCGNCLTALNPCRPSIYRFYSKRQNQHAGQQPATS